MALSIFAYVSLMEGESKGGTPITIQYRRQPRDHAWRDALCVSSDRGNSLLKRPSGPSSEELLERDSWEFQRRKLSPPELFH